MNTSYASVHIVTSTILKYKLSCGEKATRMLVDYPIFDNTQSKLSRTGLIGRTFAKAMKLFGIL